MVSKGQFVGLDWNRITRLHSQVVTGTRELTNSITHSSFSPGQEIYQRPFCVANSLGITAKVPFAYKIMTAVSPYIA